MSINENRIGSDAKIILALMKKQPQTEEELVQDTEILRKTVKRRIVRLQNRGVVKESEDGYVLFNYIGVSDAFKKIKERGHKEISLDELAQLVRKPPNEIEQRAFELAMDFGIKIVKESDVLNKLNYKRFRDIKW